MIFASRQPRLIVIAAVNSYQLFHLVVVRRQVFVANRPRNLPAITRGLSQVQIGVPESDATPHVGLPAAAPNADELEILSVGPGVRRSSLVHVEVRRPLTLRQSLPPFPGFDVRPELRAL